MLKNSKELINEIDSLEGNICRMSVCDDFNELQSMCFFAQLRIHRIYEYNHDRLRQKKIREQEIKQ